MKAKFQYITQHTDNKNENKLRKIKTRGSIVCEIEGVLPP